MLTIDFLTKSIFLPHEHDLIRAPNASGLFTIHHGPEELRKKEKRNVRWSHVRLDRCTAHFRMEQTHLLSRWLPVWGSVHSENTWLRRRVVPITGFHSPRLSFILFDKNDKHISLFTMRFSSFVKPWKKVWLYDNAQTRGDFCLQNSNLWMDSNGKLWWRHNVLNPSKIVL